MTADDAAVLLSRIWAALPWFIPLAGFALLNWWERQGEMPSKTPEAKWQCWPMKGWHGERGRWIAWLDV